MQSYGDFQQIPRKISESSSTCMAKHHIFGQIAETDQKVVQRALSTQGARNIVHIDEILLFEENEVKGFKFALLNFVV